MKLIKRILENRIIQYHFWRSYNQQEVDLIELIDRKMSGYEFKYSQDKKVKAPSAFSGTYPEAIFTRISKDNYLEWIS
ncbi:MAG: hypothetical protein ABI760_20020 [Ferruginibacter sp.]